MQSAKQQVERLIHDYQIAVYRAVALLNAKSEQDRGFQRYERAGHLDEAKQVRYQFHGTGCFVTTPEFRVDFDYACEGGCTGIDTWFMVDFLKSNPAIKAKYPLLTNGDQVEQILQELAEEGVLTRFLYAADDRRYYVTTDIDDPSLPTITLFMPDEEIDD